MKTVKTIAGPAIAGMLAMGIMTSPALRAQDTQSERDNRALVESGMKAWADGTGSPYDLLADDARWTITGNSRAAKTYPSKAGFLAEVIRPFNARMRDRLIPTVHRYHVEGDRVIIRFDASGVARDGKPYTNSYAWFLRLKDRQIVEAEAFFDSIAFDDLWTRVSPAP
jgi:ketosteroid isomerase-like protein